MRLAVVLLVLLLPLADLIKCQLSDSSGRNGATIPTTGLESKSSRQCHTDNQVGLRTNTSSVTGGVPSVIESASKCETQIERNVTNLAQLDPDEMTTLAQAAVELTSITSPTFPRSLHLRVGKNFNTLTTRTQSVIKTKF